MDSYLVQEDILADIDIDIVYFLFYVEKFIHISYLQQNSLLLPFSSPETCLLPRSLSNAPKAKYYKRIGKEHIILVSFIHEKTKLNNMQSLIQQCKRFLKT
jgi:hypothetical protein